MAERITTADGASEERAFAGYRVVAKLRSGPITDLYRAEQVALGRPVFIKALGRGILPGSPFAATLEREARLLTELDHPNVLRLLDFVRDDTSMWLVLEYVDGLSLDQIIEKKGRLSPAMSVGVALAVTEGLGFAHARGIVHRDVQPHNILVAKNGAVKVANFAAAADERLPTAPELLDGSAGFGTPAYMSPEQLLGEPEDARSDLFSLGIVLYEMLTGKRPFDAKDDRASSHRVRHDPAPPVSRLSPGVSGSLDRAVRRCLAKLPSDRHASADELGRTLSAELEDTGFRSSGEAVAAEMVRLGFSVPPPGAPARREAGRMVAARQRPITVGAALRGYLVALAFIVAGGSAVHFGSAFGHGDKAPQNSGARLELLPPRPAYLRVVADPWANVIVDGEQVDTTPFARPIPLPAGLHYVRLEHPNAPAERRTVALQSGETVLLDVKMDIPRARSLKVEAPAGQSLTDPSTP